MFTPGNVRLSWSERDESRGHKRMIVTCYFLYLYKSKAFKSFWVLQVHFYNNGVKPKSLQEEVSLTNWAFRCRPAETEVHANCEKHKNTKSQSETRRPDRRPAGETFLQSAAGKEKIQEKQNVSLWQLKNTKQKNIFFLIWQNNKKKEKKKKRGVWKVRRFLHLLRNERKWRFYMA